MPEKAQQIRDQQRRHELHVGGDILATNNVAFKFDEGSATVSEMSDGSFVFAWRRIFSQPALAPGSGLIVDRADGNKLIPYNYMVFGVSRYEGE